MIFHHTLDACRRSGDVAKALQNDIALLGIERLPLQQGLAVGSHVIDTDLQVTLLGTVSRDDVWRVRAGIFFSSVIAGCSCTDDPTPLDSNAEYCEMQFDINRLTGETTIDII